MSSDAIATVTKMLEPLSEPAQERVVEHLREYLLELEDERSWDAKFKGTQDELAAAAQRARKDIAQGIAQPLDIEQL